MFNQNLFKAKIIEKGFSMKDIWSGLGIAPSTLYRKILHNGNFSRREIEIISEILNLSLEESVNIFFAKKLT